MRLLLDSHVFLWMHVSPDRLSSGTRELLADAEPSVLLSVVTPWELGIKVASKKLKLPESLEDYVLTRVQLARMALLPIELRHVIESASLPAHHGDPFDRMLIAQARVEELTVVTADPWFSRYDVSAGARPPPHMPMLAHETENPSIRFGWSSSGISKDFR